jgi:hypothetical protein
MVLFFREVKMHYFVDLCVYGRCDKLEINKKFNLSTHTVTNIFRYLIPKKYNFLNLLKLNIACISNNNTETRKIIDFDGYGECIYDNFNFDEYFKISRKEQNLIILNVIEETINKIIIGEKYKEIFEIIDYIKKSDFYYEFIAKKFYRQNKNKTYRAGIKCVVDDNGENAFFVLFNEKNEMIEQKHILCNGYNEFYNNIYKTKWNNNVFEIINRKGEIFCKYEI